MAERSPQRDTLVVVFGKPAVPGRVKTRLAEGIGEVAAAEGYRAFFCDVVEMAGRVCRDRGWELALAWPGEAQDPLAAFAVDTAGARLVPQGPGDLGERMERAIAQGLQRGHSQVIIIGSDSPTLGQRHLVEAQEALNEQDLVFGPSFDGGYYLVGCVGRGPWRSIFREIPWSTSGVMGETLRRVGEGALLYELLEFWYDIDRPEDLAVARYHLLEYMGRRRSSRARRTRAWLEGLESKLVD